MNQSLQFILQRTDIAHNAIGRHAACQTLKPITKRDMIGRTLIEQAAYIITNLRALLWLGRQGPAEKAHVIGQPVSCHSRDGDSGSGKRGNDSDNHWLTMNRDRDIVESVAGSVLSRDG